MRNKQKAVVLGVLIGVSAMTSVLAQLILNATAPAKTLITSLTTAQKNAITATEVAVAKVRSTGDDSTGSVASGAPFLTVGAALDALPSTGGIVDIGVGTFTSPASAKIKEGVWFRGSGKPKSNSVVTATSYNTTTRTSPTKLVGGTILQGLFAVPYNVNNVTISDLGVDCGSDWCTASNGGAAENALVLAQDYNAGGGAGYGSADGVHRLQTTTPPRTGIRVSNVAALCKTATDFVHAFLIESCYEASVSGVTTYFGFAGIIIKCIGGVFSDLHANGHGSFGIIVKSNDYAWGTGNVVTNWECRSIASFDGAGFYVDAGDSGSPGINGLVIADGVSAGTKFGLKTAGGSNNIDGLLISNVSAHQCQGIGFEITASVVLSKITGCHARGNGGDGFTITGSGTASKSIKLTGCSSNSNSGDGFDLTSAARIDFEDLHAVANGGYGIRAGSNVYGTVYSCVGNTSGATTGTINAQITGRTNLTEFLTQTADSVFYSDGSGDVKELTLGASGTYLKSNGAGVAPSFGSPPSGTITVKDIDGTPSISANTIEFTNGTVTDQTGGVARVTISGGGGASDLLSDLTSAEISVTGTVTATISQMHVCSGTSADYTVTLPAASGNTGKLIGFRMATGLTKLVTLDGNASETIDGSLTRIMWAGESAILLCDGSNWFKIAGKSIPLKACIEGAAATSIASATSVRVDMNTTIEQSNSSMVDLSTDRITVLRPGSYIISAMVSYEKNSVSLAGFESYCDIGINGSGASGPPLKAVVPTNLAGSNTYSHVSVCATRTLALNDYITLLSYQSTGQTFTTRTTASVRPYLQLVEVPSW